MNANTETVQIRDLTNTGFCWEIVDADGRALTPTMETARMVAYLADTEITDAEVWSGIPGASEILAALAA